ncbi:MAG: hypothetical protein OXB84_02015 [Halobacteriovoraceae bacterium]|nr:hypothetical protein [Halobacteriovoraceae bacterium]
MSNLKKKVFFPLLVLLLLNSCGENTGANDLSFQQSITVGSVSAVRLEDERYLFSGTMPDGGDSSRNFRFKIKNPGPEESVSFFFFSDRNLRGGLEVILSASEEGMAMKFSLNGTEHETFLVSESDAVNISIDVHNNHSDMHIIVWRGNQSVFADNEDCVDEGTCLYNTERFIVPEGPWGGQGKAIGTYWGFAGDKDLILELHGPLRNLSDV